MDLRVGEPQLWHQWGREEWIIPFWVNLKNSFGAYIGLKRYVVFARNGSVDWQAVQTASNLKAATSSFEYFPITDDNFGR